MRPDEVRKVNGGGPPPNMSHSDSDASQDGVQKGGSPTALPKATSQYLMGARMAAEWLGVPLFTLYSWAQGGKIPHIKLGRRVMFCKEDLRRWVDAHRRFVEG